MYEHNYVVYTSDLESESFKQDIDYLVDVVFRDKVNVYLTMTCYGYSFLATNYPEWDIAVLYSRKGGNMTKEQLKEKLFGLARKLENGKAYVHLVQLIKDVQDEVNEYMGEE